MTQFLPRFLSDYAPYEFTIKSVDLQVTLLDQKTSVISTLVIEKTASCSSTLSLNGEHLLLRSVKLDNKRLTTKDYLLSDTHLTIPVQSSHFTLVIETEINPEENSSLEGLFKSGGAFCTQCEAEGFRRITYYPDRPDVMSVFTTTVIADKKLYPYLLSNGNSIDSGDLTDGLHFVKWHDPFAKPCYLFALVAGDFDLLTDNFTTQSKKDVKLEIFVDKGNLTKASHAMESLKASMKWDEATFGLEYDLDIYMIVAVDFFNMGAMENKGLNVFNSKFVLADETTATDTDYFNIEAVIAHEYFHNWTGNRVTCRDWFQLSLKEGLTVFRDQQFSADMHSSSVTRIQNVRILRSLQFAEDSGPMAHPIRPEEVVEMNNFYTLTVYEKGAEVIRMLHTLLGKDNFRLGMDLYFKRFDGMAVTCDDFIDAMSDASGIPLTQFKLWYQQSGTPQLSVQEEFDSTTHTFTLTIEQNGTTNSKNKITEPLHIPIKLELLNEEQSEQHLIELTQEQQQWTFEHFVTKPSVAFLAEFTAPVKVNYPQNDKTLERIMLDAKDEFCRWDAGQKLYVNYIIALIKDGTSTLPENLLTIFKNILAADVDIAFKAEQMLLPTFHELADIIDEVNPTAIVNALEKIKLFFAEGAKQELTQLYQANHQAIYNNSKEAIAKRALKNTCLSYLSLLNDCETLVNSQYHSSDNMTDTLAALNASAANNLSCFNEQMSLFEKQWFDTPLVMDKWFSISVCLNDDNIYEHLEALTSHQLFSLNNPNRARSLIGAFANNNPKYFHCESGRGYQFIAKYVGLLNEINPQVASRLITPLIQYKGFNKQSQDLIKVELNKLAALENLSNDLKEKLDAALL